jgi:hypothetical protein
MLLLIGALSVAPASGVEADNGWSLAIDGALYSRYLWRGMVLADGPVLQPSASLSHNNLTATLWGSMELTNKKLYPNQGETAGEFTEADYMLDYSRTLLGLGLSAGFTHYRFPNTGSPPTTELYAAAALPVRFSPTVTVVRDIDQAPGYYVSAAAGGELFAFNERASLEFSGWVAWASAGYLGPYFGVRRSNLSDAALIISVPVKFGELLTLSPVLGYSLLIDSDLKDAVSDPANLWFGAALSLN